jgi:hypothetical protein
VARSEDGELDELFTVAPREFVQARNALADRLKRAGHKAQAAEVRRLPRPSPTVWAINRTARDAPEKMAELVDAVARLERAQAGRAPDLHEAIEHERNARGRVLQLALSRLAEGGHTSAETVRRLSSTLLGAAGDRSARAELTRGRLTEDRQAVGFDLLSTTPIRPAADERKRDRDDRVPAPRPTLGKVAKLPLRAAMEDGRRRREEERRAREAARRANAQARARDRRAAALEREAARHRRSAQKAEREAAELRARLRRVEQQGADVARAATNAAEAARRVRDDT